MAAAAAAWMRTALVVGAALLALLPTGADGVDDGTPLAMVPMIMTHDAASGYLGAGLVNKWTKTQTAGLAQQLACGARAFDARPLQRGSRTIW